jgi:hypothetical protein
MGTRSLTAFIIKGKPDREFATMYRQFDGYPEGHGVELAEFISGGQERLYNGIGCLAAQVVAHFKITMEVGGIYLEIPASRGYDEEYIYEVYTNSKGQLMMSCYEVWRGKTIFVGTPEKFIQKYKVKETA